MPINTPMYTNVLHKWNNTKVPTIFMINERTDICNIIISNWIIVNTTDVHPFRDAMSTRKINRKYTLRILLKDKKMERKIGQQSATCSNSIKKICTWELNLIFRIRTITSVYLDSIHTLSMLYVFWGWVATSYGDNVWCKFFFFKISEVIFWK